jgi:hypothetical protein
VRWAKVSIEEDEQGDTNQSAVSEEVVGAGQYVPSLS